MTEPLPGHERGVLDTSTLILSPRLAEATALPARPLITATPAELSVAPLVAIADEERAARKVHFQQAEADFDPLPFDAAAARSLGTVAACPRRAGRKTRARSYDAAIAATALAADLPVYTCNPDDLVGLEGSPSFRFRTRLDLCWRRPAGSPGGARGHGYAPRRG